MDITYMSAKELSYLPRIQDGPLEVCFGYARWFGTYFFDDRKTAIDFHEFWDAQSILEEDGEKMFVPLNRQNF